MSSLELGYIQSCTMQSDSILDDNSVQEIHKNMFIDEKSDSESLGWLNYPLLNHTDAIKGMLELAQEVRRKADVFIVVGVGGSYLGTRAIQNTLGPYFDDSEGCPKIIYAGNNLSGRYMNQLMDYIKDKEVYVNVISKSGTTLEPSITFRVLKEMLEKKYGDQSSGRIIVTTDAENGLLRKMCIEMNYRSFQIPRNIGGRYSVLTPVGLFPLAVQGIDITSLLNGAKQACIDLEKGSLYENKAYQYASIRQSLRRKGYDIELFASFEPSLKYLLDWLQQLFGESEGKEGKGIYPVPQLFSEDLHSVGQYIQEGKRNLFETIIHFSDPMEDYHIPYSNSDTDELNHCHDKTFNEINELTMEGVIKAHSDGGIPVITIQLEKLDAFSVGYLVYFFKRACAMSSYLQNVNPFNQPGVEVYKKNTLELLSGNNKRVFV